MQSSFSSVILRLRQANHTKRFYALSPNGETWIARASCAQIERHLSKESSGTKVATRHVISSEALWLAMCGVSSPLVARVQPLAEKGRHQ
jgi:hypothetical protein